MARKPGGASREVEDPTLIDSEELQKAAKIKFAKRLSAAMARKGLRQTQLAQLANERLSGKNIGRDSVSQYVRGISLPSLDRLNAMAAVLGVEPEELMPAKGVAGPNDPTGDLGVHETSDGLAWLKINRAVTWKTALKILALLNEEDEEFEKSGD